MTNGWIDIRNTDMMLIMGGNPAENHPCGFKWAIEAKRQRNATMIVVDPRFTRTAATADLFLQIRAGSDTAFLGGLINYALENGRFNKEYLVHFTNAAFVVREDFKLPDDGLFSGYDPSTRTYDKTSWNYEAGGEVSGSGSAQSAAGGAAPAGHAPNTEATQAPGKNPNPRAGAGHAIGNRRRGSGLPGLRSSGSQSDGSRRPGIDAAERRLRFIAPASALRVSTSEETILPLYAGRGGTHHRHSEGGLSQSRGPVHVHSQRWGHEESRNRIYAVGWTQHSSGTQTIRAAAMLQLVLGNVGRAGGGVNALRGHSNIQGATDMGGIYDIFPGYLKMPNPADADLATYLKRTTPASSKPSVWESYNYWSNTPKFAVSFLKAMYGDAATKENDWGFAFLPKIDRGYSWSEIWDDMYAGHVKGLFAFGMNGVAIGPNSQKNIEALKKADWLVVCEIYPDETSEFWRSPGITPEAMKSINTEVFRLPGAGFAEKDGTFVNSARWLQWKNVAVPPPGDCKLDQEILARIFLKVRELYQKEGGKYPDGLLNLAWNYSDPLNPSLAEVAKEINGRAVADVTDPVQNQTIKAGQQLPGFAWLRDDGTTSSGNWLYCGSWTEAGALTQRRGTEDPSGLGVYPNWAWSWPMNRRVMYNRAACDLAGKPWDADRSQIWWSESQKKWVGHDVPDFKVDSPPKDHMGPFIMNAEGVGRIFGPLAAFADGPFPEFYEPTESPTDNLLHPNQPHNPVARRMKSDMDKFGSPDQGYNIVCTTYRLTEHYHYWTKNNPMNVQLVPEPFVEIPAELANEMGLRGGEKVKVSSARSFYIAKAMVTRRIKPMLINGKKTYQIGIPIHWGYRGIAEDEGRTARTLANRLSPAVIDPNAYTPEFKGFLVKLEKV